jgi:hypothetical protein
VVRPHHDEGNAMHTNALANAHPDETTERHHPGRDLAYVGRVAGRRVARPDDAWRVRSARRSGL